MNGRSADPQALAADVGIGGTVGDENDVMDLVLPVLLVMIFVAVPGGLPWLAHRSRRSGAGGYTLMGSFDEMWHPIAVEARFEIQIQNEKPAPAPLPGDPLL